MRAGQLRNKIKYISFEETVGDMGETVIEEVTFAEAWASIEALRGREHWSAQQAQSEVTHRISHRYLPGVKATMEIEHGDRRFEIEHFHDVDERRKEMEVLVKERL